MPETFPAAAAAELAVVERSGFVESRHIGSAVVLDAEGNVIRQLGDPDALILPRSSLKPLQAVACLTAGAELSGETLGLATASHTGTDRHVEVIRQILATASLTEDALRCPEAMPHDSATRATMIRDHSPASRIRMECSGKHAAMLLATVANGWDVGSYLDAGHPLQLHIRETVERLSGEKIAGTAVDGCGAPVLAITLHGLARAISRMATASERSPFALYRHGAAVLRSVRENPWTIAGPGASDTVAIERLGVFAKRGAEGVMVMAAPGGTTVALKVLDGGARVGTAVAIRLLESSNALPAGSLDSIGRELDLIVSGGGRSVGSIRTTV